MRKILYRCLAGAVLLVSLAVALGFLCYRAAEGGDFRFNQHFIEDQWLESGGFPEGATGTAVRSRLRTGLRRLVSADPGPGGVDLDKPATVLAHVFVHLPPQAIVYPTETYYYWTFPYRDRRVSGNVRLLDAGKGLLHIGYFDPEDQRIFNAGTFGAADGVEIRPVPKTPENDYRATYKGRSVTFLLPKWALKASPDVRLAPGEEVVSGILDESGLAFVLLYHKGEKAFYYVLNELFPPCERLLEVEGTRGAYRIGERSRFVFFEDSSMRRKLLVGVLSRNIQENNFYDGPFDQVPPRLDLRSRLEAAYPYVRMAGGLDQHGNFLEMEGQRVAISPYQAYLGLTDLKSFLDAQLKGGPSGPALWARMTYESKRHFHQRLLQRESLPSLYGGEHQIFQSQGWPPNHWGKNSRSWPLDHREVLSRSWPPNHDAGVSRGGSPAAGSGAKRHDAALSRSLIQGLRPKKEKAGT